MLDAMAVSERRACRLAGLIRENAEIIFKLATPLHHDELRSSSRARRWLIGAVSSDTSRERARCSDWMSDRSPL